MIDSSAHLLPFEVAPVDERQRALSAQYLWPLQDEIFDLLVEIRGNLDPCLARQHSGTAGKGYPLGRCREITDAVRQNLLNRLLRPRRRVERALVEFARQGGVIRPIWGALRGRYFQNATQMGALYVDVSNDTVSIVKPKVEILPLEYSGLEPVRDIAHFQKIVRLYWRSELYANLVAPSLAPLLPMISVNEYGEAKLQSASDYMVALMMRDQFYDAEDWLAKGPPPPSCIMKAFVDGLPPDLLGPRDCDPRIVAVEACRTARTEGRYLDMEWRNSRVLDYTRFIESISTRAT